MFGRELAVAALLLHLTLVLYGVRRAGVGRKVEVQNSNQAYYMIYHVGIFWPKHCSTQYVFFYLLV